MDPVEYDYNVKRVCLGGALWENFVKNNHININLVIEMAFMNHTNIGLIIPWCFETIVKRFRYKILCDIRI